MPRVSYDPQTKDAIVKAVTGARSADKTWKDAHEAAAAAGYKGSVQGIIKLMRTVEGGGPKRRRRGRKPGRPAGKRRGRKPGPKPGASRGGDINSLIDNLVQARINEALDKAIEVLQGARG